MVQLQERALLVATVMRPEGGTGVHTHFRELRRFLSEGGSSSLLITSYSWHPALAQSTFGLRMALDRVSEAAGIAWYFHWHEVFLREALRQTLAREGEIVIYAQGPRWRAPLYRHDKAPTSG